MKKYESFVVKNLDQRKKQIEREKNATNEKERKLRILKIRQDIRELRKEERELRKAK